MRLDHPVFQDADAAREHLEAQRWPNGPSCPHCGNIDPARITKMEGKAHRPGLYNCMECREHRLMSFANLMEWGAPRPLRCSPRSSWGAERSCAVRRRDSKL